jgi:hypothetical protein
MLSNFAIVQVCKFNCANSLSVFHFKVRILKGTNFQEMQDK